MTETLFYRFVVKRDTRANFVAANTLLLDGEWSLETDTGGMKVGDGVTLYNSLPFKVGVFHATATGTNDLTVSFSIPPLFYDGMILFVRAANRNTGAVTLDVNSQGPLSVTKYGDEALAAGNIAGAGHELLLQYVSGSPARFEFLNPIPNASDIPYDNTTSGLTADNAQAAIDEVAAGGGGGGGGGGGDPIALSIYRKIIAWYELDETSGTVMSDVHTNALDGTYSGVTLNQTGLASNLGTSGLFANSSYAEISDTALLRPMFNFACMAWVKPSGTQPNFAKVIWKPSSVMSNGNANYLLQQDNFSNGGKGVFRVTSLSSGANTDAMTSSALATNTVVQLIGNRCNDQLQMWRNGTMENTTQFATPCPITTGGYPLRLGSSGGSDGLVGYYGQAAVFKDYLSPQEIAYLWNSGNGVSYTALKTAAGF